MKREGEGEGGKAGEERDRDDSIILESESSESM